MDEEVQENDPLNTVDQETTILVCQMTWEVSNSTEKSGFANDEKGRRRAWMILLRRARLAIQRLRDTNLRR